MAAVIAALSGEDRLDVAAEHFLVERGRRTRDRLVRDLRTGAQGNGEPPRSKHRCARYSQIPDAARANVAAIRLNRSDAPRLCNPSEPVTSPSKTAVAERGAVRLDEK